MSHGDSREGKWRGNWRMECVTFTLHTTSEHGVSSITTADAQTSAPSIRLNWRPPADLNGFVRFAERQNLVLHVCHHILTGLYNSNPWCPCSVISLPFTAGQSLNVTRHQPISAPVFQCYVRAHSSRQDLSSLAVRESYRWESKVVFYPLWYAAGTPGLSVHARRSM